jgi:hypothetical protein
VSDCCLTPFSNFSAISWQEQVSGSFYTQWRNIFRKVKIESPQEAFEVLYKGMCKEVKQEIDC